MWLPSPTPEVVGHMTPRKRRRVNITRDLVIFTTGLLGVAHETVISNGDRPSLLILFAAMLGLPLYLNRGG